MFINHLKTRVYRRLALAIATSALVSAVCVSPALAGGGGWGGSGPVNYVPPSINGGATVAPVLSQLTTSYGQWDNTVSYYQVQWFQCNSSGLSCQAIPGAVGTTYTPRQLYPNYPTIRSVVTAVTAAGVSDGASSQAVSLYNFH